MTISTPGSAAMGIDCDIGDYGGAPDKCNTATETTPYAWTFYRELQGMRGSAFAAKPTGFVHAENLALARSECARFRAGEKLAANSIPGTSDERLGYWAQVLGIHYNATTPNWRVRLACEARYRAAVGPTATAEDEAIAKLLGDVYVRSWRQIGTDLATPPTVTYWPGINPGPAAYGISTDGSGTPLPWLSERCHLTVEVQPLPGMAVSEFLELMNQQLFDLLDRMLPAWATFDWALAPLSDGFLLDVSQLDFNGLYP